MGSQFAGRKSDPSSASTAAAGTQAPFRYGDRPAMRVSCDPFSHHDTVAHAQAQA
jgi:hypothetical protein